MKSSIQVPLSSILRVAARAPAAFGYTLLIHGIWCRLGQAIIGEYRPLQGIKIWGYGLGRIMGIKIHERNQRKGVYGDMIVANHMGFLDIPILLSYYPSVFIIKEEMKHVFFFGRELAAQGHVFVNRRSKESGKQAGDAMSAVLEEGDRIIIFPEGRASPGAKRLPFKTRSFIEAKRLNKTVEVCIIDYLPDRREMQWDIKQPMVPQLIKLFGRKRCDVSVEFLPPERIEGDPKDYAEKLRTLIESKLEEYDREREEGRGLLDR